MRKIKIEYGERMSREEELRLMHETMTCMNHEDAYLEWICVGVPDEPSDEDFVDMAEDEECFMYTFTVFCRIFNRYKKYGLFDPSLEVLLYVYDTFQEFKVIRYATLSAE